MPIASLFTWTLEKHTQGLDHFQVSRMRTAVVIPFWAARELRMRARPQSSLKWLTSHATSPE